ncbi:MAG: radical SAM family heme chaperone HemW [Elusimicrobiota bacterium]|nr:radical SAM family heme chaperone HemW [Elusimicrobiota bacterium]
MINSVYIHLPFCLRRCSYCDFYSQTDLSLKSSYIRALEKDAVYFRSLCGEIKTLYIGGGTPSVFSAGEFSAVFEILRRNFRFSKNCETTVEVNPRSATERILSFLRANSVNRLSIGIQFLDRKLLLKANRDHSPEDAEKVFLNARKAGFSNINTDIIYGFPGQSAQSFYGTLKRITALDPEHISAYIYTPPSGRKNILKEAPPKNNIIASMYETLCRELKKSGFAHYEISNFAKPGKKSRHNINYWRRGGYAGLGAGAVSSFGSKRLTGAFIKSYLRAPLKKSEETLDRKKMNFEKKFLALRTLEGIPYRKKHDKFIARGWVKKKNEKSVFTEKGWLVSNSVISEL